MLPTCLIVFAHSDCFHLFPGTLAVCVLSAPPFVLSLMSENEHFLHVKYFSSSQGVSVKVLSHPGYLKIEGLS